MPGWRQHVGTRHHSNLLHARPVPRGRAPADGQAQLPPGHPPGCTPVPKTGPNTAPRRAHFRIQIRGEGHRGGAPRPRLLAHPLGTGCLRSTASAIAPRLRPHLPQSVRTAPRRPIPCPSRTCPQSSRRAFGRPAPTLASHQAAGCAQGHHGCWGPRHQGRRTSLVAALAAHPQHGRHAVRGRCSSGQNTNMVGVGLNAARGGARRPAPGSDS